MTYTTRLRNVVFEATKASFTQPNGRRNRTTKIRDRHLPRGKFFKSLELADARKAAAAIVDDMSFLIDSWA